MVTVSREFQVMVKPIGAVCNLDCRYCYYLSKRDLYPNGGPFRMADDLLESPALLEFGRNKRERLPRYCRQCDFLAMCNGGCPKDRLASTPEGEEGLNYLCSGLKQFYTHSRPYLQKLAWHRRSGEPIENYMRLLKSEEAAAAPQANRNDPCPCGSGRKYKKCCLLNLSP